MRTFTVAERRARLARRHFLSQPASSVADTTGTFVGLHATDPSTPYLSLVARLPGFTVDDLDGELYQRRTLLKHLAMRRTLWIVRTEDLPLVQAGASDRVAGNEQRKLVGDVEKAGVAADGARWLDTACQAVLAHLREHGPTPAAQLRTALPELAGSFDPAPGKRWGGETPLSPRVLTVLGVRGEIVRGPNDSGWTNSRPRWAVTSEWLGTSVPRAEPDHARTELVRTWLRTFGPATVTDIKWWFGNTLTWA
ncbi:winged helix DNA-binding domain-containing protein, partial [Mycolicibacterium porcinum]